MTCEQRRDLILLYVADALDDADQTEVRRHLAGGCVACAGHLAEAQATFAAVPLSLDPVAPPAGLKQRLMDRIDRSVGTATADRRSWAWRVFPAAAAAALAAVGTYAVVGVHRPAAEARLTHDADARMALLRTVVADRDRTVDELRARLAGQQQLVQALQSPRTQVVALAGLAAQPHAAARLVWQPAAGRSVLLASGLAPPPPGRTYELWYITAAPKPVRAVTFTVDSDGSATITATIPPGLSPLAMAAVSDEPAGGTDAPTAGHVLMAGKVP